ncbi:hypothetical protein KY290_014082 [Solanum tuberosum]|uniref:RNase H family protein n=1 Tax=Solanum tuberosum TaxID=4113 RepID=A0ABQ7VPV6_SOLTU|nr:hypothetical protein KY289_014179 [Solanum tuberosum]KAH0770101.1 hypothetical protein KY290_014082 [Solanum tuberosum]
MDYNINWMINSGNIINESWVHDINALVPLDTLSLINSIPIGNEDKAIWKLRSEMAKHTWNIISRPLGLNMIGHTIKVALGKKFNFIDYKWNWSRVCLMAENFKTMIRSNGLSHQEQPAGNLILMEATSKIKRRLELEAFLETKWGAWLWPSHILLNFALKIIVKLKLL